MRYTDMSSHAFTPAEAGIMCRVCGGSRYKAGDQFNPDVLTMTATTKQVIIAALEEAAGIRNGGRIPASEYARVAEIVREAHPRDETEGNDAP